MTTTRTIPSHRAAATWFRITAICSALLLEGMSASSINVQIAAVGTDLHTGPTELQLIASAFLIAYAGLLPAAGRLVDVWSRRATFRWGIALFGVGCILCTIAPSAWVLVLGRFAQGAGAALSAPAALALITASMPAGRPRHRALALYGAMGAVGFSLGLVLPGFVVAGWGWRASFLLLVPLVVLVLAGTWRVPDDRDGAAGRLDLRGAILLTMLLAVGMHLIGGFGADPATAVQALLVVCLTVVLVRREGGAGFPAEVVRSRRVLAACMALAGVYAGVVSSTYVLSLALQLGAGRDAFEVGLYLVPEAIAFSACAGLGGRLVSRHGPGLVLAAGMALIILSVGYLGLTGFDRSYLTGFLPPMLGIGAALGLCYPAASITAVDAAPVRHHGTTAGLLTTWQNVGAATGLAVATALAVVPAADRGFDPSAGLYLSGALVAAGGLAAALIARSPR